MIAAVVFRVTIAAWAVGERVLVVREHRRGQGGRVRDRSSRLLIVAAIAATAVLGALGGAIWPWSALPGGWPVAAIATPVMWLGLAIRGWAVVSLGRSFRTTVEVDAGQPVVSRGPYRWVRHPAYTGLMLIVIGLEVGLGDWLGVAAAVVLLGAAVLRRIRVEEAELARVLGEPWRAYRERTKRLVPGVW